jgi:hypothetical protein
MTFITSISSRVPPVFLISYWPQFSGIRMNAKTLSPLKPGLKLSVCCLLQFALAFALLPVAGASAWIDTGHKIAAIITWHELTPAAKAQIIKLLKEHPRYEKDLLNGLPQGTDEEGTTRFAFANAACWPDLVRGPAHPMHFVANHPIWHYVDIPYVIDNQPVPAATQPASTPGPQNAIEAFAKVTKDLKDPALVPADKAIALCWVLHLCGDIHQPLHSTSLFSPQYPNGDQGGNAIIVLRDPPYPNSQQNLHFIWDSMPGNYKSLDWDSYAAEGLRQDPRFTRQRLKDFLAVKDFAAWANESHELAIKNVYLEGKLKGISSAELKADPKAVIPGVPKGYIEQAEQVVNQRIMLAGYRTADLLNSIFDSK